MKTKATTIEQLLADDPKASLEDLQAAEKNVIERLEQLRVAEQQAIEQLAVDRKRTRASEAGRAEVSRARRASRCAHRARAAAREEAERDLVAIRAWIEELLAHRRCLCNPLRRHRCDLSGAAARKIIQPERGKT